MEEVFIETLQDNGGHYSGLIGFIDYGGDWLYYDFSYRPASDELSLSEYPIFPYSIRLYWEAIRQLKEMILNWDYL